MASSRSGKHSGLLADEAFLLELRREMQRFAVLQLSNREEAEDAVQDALAGALKNADSFRADAALKTWVIAILKNKVADILRQRQRNPISASQMASETDMGAAPSIFDRRGMWHDDDRPARWEDPEGDLHSRQFMAVFDACLNRLPPQQGRVFMMREVVELRTEEICAELGLSANNVHVILHRARLALRACLQHNWINPGAEPC